MNAFLLGKESRAYLFLTALVIVGMTGGLIAAVKVVHFGLDFPFSVAFISIFTYPIIDCICELWGKQVARQTLWLGLFAQILMAALIQLSIYAPHADYWTMQSEYSTVLSLGLNVMLASLAAFTVSQIVDIFVYQKIKEFSHGKWLWLRSNISVYLGQAIDSVIFVNIVFYNLDQKFNILFGAITAKIILSFLMTPVVYLIVLAVNRYLDNNTLAFKTSVQLMNS